MAINSFEILIDKFERMEIDGVIDSSAILELQNAIDNCLKNEEFWIKSENHISDSFLMYHATRNNRLIAEKIKERLHFAKNKGDNPKIALDALKILPSMAEIFNLISFMENKKLSQSVVDYISSQSRVLREKAEVVSLLPSIKDESASLDKRKVRSRFNRLVKAVEDDSFEIQGIF